MCICICNVYIYTDMHTYIYIYTLTCPRVWISGRSRLGHHRRTHCALRFCAAESVHRRWSAHGESETRVDLQLEFRSSPSPA